MYTNIKNNYKLAYYSKYDNLNKFNIKNLFQLFYIHKISITLFLDNNNLNLKLFYILYNFFFKIPFLISKTKLETTSNKIQFKIVLQNQNDINSFLRLIFVENNILIYHIFIAK